MTDPVTVAGTAEQPAGEPCVLLKLGEVVLKGRNRHQFERLLQLNIRAAAEESGLPVELLPREGVVVLLVAPQERTAAEHAAVVDRVAERVSDVPGIVRVCRAVRVAKTPDVAVAAAAIEPDRAAAGRVRGAGAAAGQAVPGDLARAGGEHRPRRCRRRTGCR